MLVIYTGEYTNEISFPLGGIGTGSIGLAGNGRLIDWEIFNRPAKGSDNGYTHIAVKAEYGGKAVVKVLCGDQLTAYAGSKKSPGNHGIGHGVNQHALSSFPHFKNCTFDGEFPFARLCFEDEKFPGKIILKAFNPLIPTDSKNSSIPTALFDIEIQNTTDKSIRYSAAFSLQNPFPRSVNKRSVNGGITMLTACNDDADTDSPQYGDLTVAAAGRNVFCQTYWYRGGWQDGLEIFQNEFSTGRMTDRMYDEAGAYDVGTVVTSSMVGAGDEGLIRFALTWNIPNNHRYWNEPDPTVWKNYYATVFKDSRASAEYCLKNYEYLLGGTKKFHDALFSSTLEKTVIDAVSATLSVLKSPTVLRLEDGSFYGWEGTNEDEGSCEGTCQHVWNYAYALCFLFPDLERSIRDLEFKYCLKPSGETAFRLKLPLGSGMFDFRACLDGQMGTVVKCFREWKISGDDTWLRTHWEDIKSILEYAWSDENCDKWDADKDGVLEGRQHHTLDMELFGPSPWLEGMYLLALSAAAEMAEYLGDTQKKAEYLALFKKGYEWTKENLFNGKYFIQKIDLSDKRTTDAYGADSYWNDEKNEIKYQIGNGSLLDQMLAQWHADILGLGDIFDKSQRKCACRNVYKNNFKQSLRDFVNPWRVFALNDESGAVICDYPDGVKKPYIPIPYSTEVMTGFEYAFAGLLISENMQECGLRVIDSVRKRYDGKKRNPWSEMECGNNYARAMASFALIPIFAGFEFHLPKKYIGFNPINDGYFKTVWSLGSGWGTFEKSGGRAIIRIERGNLKLEKIGMRFADNITKLTVDGKNVDFSFTYGIIHIKTTTALENITAEWE